MKHYKIMERYKIKLESATDTHQHAINVQFKQANSKKMAEREGFEPSVEEAPTPVFETDPFNRSGTSPYS